VVPQSQSQSADLGTPDHAKGVGRSRWAGVLFRIEIAIAMGFLLGFAFTLAICAWRESSGTGRKTESAVSGLE